MTNFLKKLEQYAEITVKVGLNIQPGQALWINAPILAPELVRFITAKAYEAGAKDVYVEWYDDTITQLKYKMAPDEAFEQYPAWRVQAVEEIAENVGAYLLIDSRDPELLKDAAPDRIAAYSKAAGKALSKWRQHMTSDKFSWTIIGAASRAWAKMVFPDLDGDEAVQALWEAIFQASRVTGDNPVGNWEQHSASLQSKREYLTQKQYRKLHYRADGTELTVELPKGHIWAGASAMNEKGASFSPNIPTEEVFTSPSREGTNGYVRSSKPLSYQGNIIENFAMKFENGKVVDFQAEQGYEALKGLLDLDEGARYLGEVALVPHDSPISNSNLIFYQTLYDENASSHLAIGQSFAFCLENGKNLSPEERLKAGLNDSNTHVDFMIGTADMDIDGETADGRLEPVFRKGNWAF
ncbi:aminopeptidase [Cohnella candidum]|uniref:aminopeptidase n=1 Tax=Cohnella candidum TaxID=2674991 RepID=UPI0013DE437F|nr:aminopeptidase [Cohnella candidum]